jgi:hypothetical protein
VALSTKENTTHGNGIDGNALDKKVSLEKTAQSRAVSGAVNAINGIAMTNIKSWYEGECEYCSEPFKKKTTWQRFCCTEHQAAAYELRTGKKWYGKKVSKAG